LHGVTLAGSELGELALPELNAPLNDRLYRSLCWAISGRWGEVDWEAFSSAEWKRLIGLAPGEGVAPLLYCALQSAGVRPPAAAMQVLMDEYYRTAAQNTLLLNELECILHSLAKAGVPVIVLKGASLTRSVYSDPALRPMNDLDLLIPPHCVGRALSCLQNCGYAVEKITYHVMLQGGPQQLVTLELHWTLPDVPPAVSGEVLEWLFALPEGDPGRSVFEFLYLCAHLILQHAANAPRLIWFYDLYLLAERQSLPAVEPLAVELGWQSVLAAALQGLAARFGISPLWHLDVTALSLSLDAQQQRIRRWMLSALQALPWVDRLRMLIGFLFPSPAYLRWRYQPRPSWLWPLGYARRWGEMARESIHG